MAIFIVTTCLLVLAVDVVVAQQLYSQDWSEDCDKFHRESSGYICNGAAKTCDTFLLYRAQQSYMSLANISELFDTDPTVIASASNLSTKNFHNPLSKDQQVLIPITCKCTGNFSQANLTYTVKHDDTYINIANLTLEGLTTCQAMKEQNPRHPPQELQDGMKLVAPLRCACPTPQQVAKGVKFLLSYIVDPDDDDDIIPAKFKITHEDFVSANELGEEPNPTIYPYTTLLIPLQKTPTIPPSGPLSPPPPPVLPLSPPFNLNPLQSEYKSSSHVYIPVAASIGGAFLLVILVGAILIAARRNRASKSECKSAEHTEASIDIPSKLERDELLEMPDLVALDKLTIYSFKELQEAIENFSGSRRIKGSVFRGILRGKAVAIKQMKGQVSQEMNMLHKFHHARLVGLVGICISDTGHSYLIFEYAENGSLNEWLHGTRSRGPPTLGWSQRIRIALDIAEGLEYLHHNTTSSCIHKDLKSSNILLDGNFRAKIANFGLARTGGGGSAVQALTRHIVGTQGYMAPEYLSDGFVTPKLDVFAYGVILLEILSGKEAIQYSTSRRGESLLSDEIRELWDDAENPREKLSDWLDPRMKGDASYSLEVALAVAMVAKQCVEIDLSLRPSIRETRLRLSKFVDLSSTIEDGNLSGAKLTNSLELQGR